MYAMIRLLLVLVAGGTMVLASESRTKAEELRERPGSPGNAPSVARFALDQFMGAVRVRPRALAQHPHLGLLPLPAFVQGVPSLKRLEAMGVEEAAVFLGALSGSERSSKLEWALAARLSEPIELESAIRKWHESVVPGRQPDTRAVAIRVDGQPCFRVAAGSFLPRDRTRGTLRFLGRDGAPAKRGINIGNAYAFRGYVEGGTQSAAVFGFEGLDETHLVDGKLVFELRPDVFATYYRDQDYATAQIELRNPATGLRSAPILFKVQSHVNRRVAVPRRLLAGEGEARKQVDLLSDLLANGRLEVILKLTDPAIYIGVAPDDLNIQREVFEYVHVSGHEIVVAQSAATLRKMLQAPANPGALAKRLSTHDAEAKPVDLVLVTEVRNAAERVALKELLRLRPRREFVEHLAETLTELQVTVDAEDHLEAAAVARFERRADAAVAAGWLHRLRYLAMRYAADHLEDSLGRLAATANLTSIGLDGIPLGFAAEGTPTIPQRKSELLILLGQVLGGFEIGQQDETLRLEFREPAGLANLTPAEQLALANLEEILARDLFEREQFEAAVEMFRRVTDRLPDDPRAWYRRAHQLAYNTSVEFNAFAHRYAWVHRGIDVLLDGAERNSNDADPLWLAARIIGWKIGASDERAAFRTLFSEDKELHRRLAKWIDLGAARSADGKIDNWLVARELFDAAAERRRQNDRASQVPLAVRLLRPLIAQTQYAVALGESNAWDEARDAWKEAERLFVEAGNHPIELGDGKRVTLSEFLARMPEFGPDNLSLRLLQSTERLLDYDYWLARCKLEQTDEIQAVHKLARQAADSWERAEVETAYDLYQKALERLSTANAQYPDLVPEVAADFTDLAKSYREAVRVLEEDEEDASLAGILKVIEGSVEDDGPTGHHFEFERLLPYLERD